MLREPSFKPVHQDGEDGSGSGESETEVEATNIDSEGETESERPVPSSRMKGMRKTTVPVPSSSMASVQEENAGPSAIPNRHDVPVTPTLRPIITESKNSANLVRSLPTPTQKDISGGSSTQFGFHNPATTPGTTPPGTTTPWHPSVTSSNALSGTQSAAGSSIQSSTDSSGYFYSHLTSVPACSAALPLTPRASEPIVAESTAGVRLGAVIEPVAGRTGADADGSEDEDGTDESSHESSSPPRMAASRSDSRPSPSRRPALYNQPSQSMVNLTSSRKPESCLRLDSPNALALETIRSNVIVPNHIDIPDPPAVTSTEWANKPPPPPGVGSSPFFGADKALKRRRSAEDLTALPPKYEPPFPGTCIPRPRDEEGHEALPEYWCAVHIEGSLSRKMEFSAPGVQSRDRAWKKLYFILRGTTLYVYKFDPHKFPLKVDAPVPIGDESDTELYLHVHLPSERRASLTNPVVPAVRRGSIDDTSYMTGRRGSDARSSTDSGRRPSVTSPPWADAKDASLFNSTRRASVSNTTSGTSATSGSSIAGHLPFQHNALVKQYTLQLAESGLAADYVKKPNVVRVRAEGEQFLLQNENARDVVDWIEVSLPVCHVGRELTKEPKAFQAATNVALDLDERPMPKIITLPRRRRRITIAGATPGAGDAVSDAVNPAIADTQEGNAAVVAAAAAAAVERRESP